MSAINGLSTSVQPNILTQSKTESYSASGKTTSQNSTAELAQESANQDFQKLAQDIIAKRAESTDTSTQPASAGRGQVLDILV